MENLTFIDDFLLFLESDIQKNNIQNIVYALQTLTTVSQQFSENLNNIKFSNLNINSSQEVSTDLFKNSNYSAKTFISTFNYSLDSLPSVRGKFFYV